MSRMIPGNFSPRCIHHKSQRTALFAASNNTKFRFSLHLFIVVSTLCNFKSSSCDLNLKFLRHASMNIVKKHFKHFIKLIGMKFNL